MPNLTGNTIKPYTVWQICEIYEHFQADALHSMSSLQDHNDYRTEIIHAGENVLHYNV